MKDQQRIQALWIYFLLAPSNPRPEDDGSFYIGDVGKDAERSWLKHTPYSPAETK